MTSQFSWYILCSLDASERACFKPKFRPIHRCTRFENPWGGSMRFLPNFGRNGVQGLWKVLEEGTPFIPPLHPHPPSCVHLWPHWKSWKLPKPIISVRYLRRITFFIKILIIYIVYYLFSTNTLCNHLKLINKLQTRFTFVTSTPSNQSMWVFIYLSIISFKPLSPQFIIQFYGCKKTTLIFPVPFLRMSLPPTPHPSPPSVHLWLDRHRYWHPNFQGNSNKWGRK
jgi:hypothetical protein